MCEKLYHPTSFSGKCDVIGYMLLVTSFQRLTRNREKTQGGTMAEAPGAHSLREVELNTDDRYGFRREFRKQK